jgi:hypothetical protein
MTKDYLGTYYQPAPELNLEIKTPVKAWYEQESDRDTTSCVETPRGGIKILWVDCLRDRRGRSTRLSLRVFG